MGYSNATPSDFTDRAAYRAATHTTFVHTATMASTPRRLRTVHESVDPMWRNHDGEQVRECRDSDVHPLTVPVVVGFDETGSMGDAPEVLQQKLATLKGATLRAGLADVQLCFAAYGDAQNDEVAPCQVGQFESGLEMEDWLNNLYLEGNGGGNGGETAGLLLYFLARHSRLDSLERRGKRGYIVLTGDEVPMQRITRAEVKRYIGDELEGDLTIQDVVAEVSRLYDVYFFLVNNGTAAQQGSRAVWEKLLGDGHVIVVETLDNISEQIAMMIGRLEGAFGSLNDAVQALVAAGADPHTARKAGQDLARFDRGIGAGIVPANVTGNLPAASASGPARTRRL